MTRKVRQRRRKIASKRCNKYFARLHIFQCCFFRRLALPCLASPPPHPLSSIDIDIELSQMRSDAFLKGVNFLSPVVGNQSRLRLRFSFAYDFAINLSINCFVCRGHTKKGRSERKGERIMWQQLMSLISSLSFERRKKIGGQGVFPDLEVSQLATFAPN